MTYTIYAGSNLDILPTLADNSVDAIVTDPPYGLSDNKYVAETITRWIQGERDFIPDGKGFMGKAWDAFVPPPALWDECLRVLKPGGHLLAFFGSRTQDIGALSIRLAGFEIRDSIAWMYGSGFPKSLDISKAIDKGTGENSKRQLQFTSWMRNSGLSASKARDVLYDAGLITEQSNQASHYFAQTMGSQPAIATAEMFDALRPYLPEVPEEIERLVAERTGIEWIAYKNREVIGQKTGTKSVDGGGHGIVPGGITEAVSLNITAPATPEAKQWEGWGTALKPAFEPIVVARKPLIGTVAENVLTHGTGGLNIDGSRIGTEGGTAREGKANQPNDLGWANMKGHGITELNLGRWPSNVILDPYTAELLDEQSGVRQAGGFPKKVDRSNSTIYGDYASEEREERISLDSGGASRFFYVAKASKRDRNEGLDNLPLTDRGSHNQGMQNMDGGRDTFRQNFHPTVKPTDLMRYLVKLVTPPGGVVLDPFTGSGSTGKAAILEGFDFIGIELTEEYLPIIEGRLAHAEQMRSEQEAKKDEALF